MLSFYDGERLSLVTAPVTAGTIPADVTTSRDICIWAASGLRPLLDERMAAIAVRDTHVCLSAKHTCLDGDSWFLLMERFARGEFQPQLQFPVPLDKQLRNLLSSSRKPMDHIFNMRKISMIPWTSPPHITTEDDVHSDFLMGDYAPSEMNCYNARTGKYIGLSDALWRASILTAHAMKPQRLFGCLTWVNVRRFMKDDSIGCSLAPCSIVAEGVSNDMTVGELEKRLRKDFIAKMKRNHFLDGVKAMVDGIPNPQPPGAHFDISNVGYFGTFGPFVDVWVQMTALAKSATGDIGLSSAVTFGNENAKLTLRYPYSQFVFTRAEASRDFKEIVHSMKHIGPKVKVGDAIRELKEISA
jgi:hypothetical protein